MYASYAWSGSVNKRDQTSHPFQTSSSLMKFNIMSITFSTTYLLHPRLAHSDTTSGEDHILSCFRNTLDTLWTLTSLLEYYTKTFTVAIV